MSQDSISDLERSLAQAQRELSEALERQAASDEVLRVISSSAGELDRVFQAMLANATRICQAAFGSMLLGDGQPFRRVTLHNAPQKFAAFNETAPSIWSRDASSLDRIVRTKQVVHIPDVAAEDPNEPIAKFASARTLLLVPMLKEDELIGLIWHLPPRGASVHGKTDRACPELRKPGSHCYRERPSAQRTSHTHGRPL
jgi:GAF domain-containing protein